MANFESNSASDQRARLLEHLKAYGSGTTIELRKNLDIMMPAARVHELRHQHGLQIDLVWVHQHTDAGKLHRVGKYILQSSGKGAL